MSIKLEFSEKYDQAHSLRYLKKHQETLARRLSHWRDVQMARRALHAAGDPGLVLDLPSGAGRFWPVLAEKQNRIIFAADNSQDMLDVARRHQPAAMVNRVRTFRTSAFAIDLGDSSVDCIFSMRLMHHVAQAEHRLAMLSEFHRVSRDTVILSLWVDGNFKSWRRRRLEDVRMERGELADGNRFVIPRAVIEQEFRATGFTILNRQDFIPGYAMWRVYALRKQA